MTVKEYLKLKARRSNEEILRLSFTYYMNGVKETLKELGVDIDDNEWFIKNMQNKFEDQLKKFMGEEIVRELNLK